MHMLTSSQLQGKLHRRCMIAFQDVLQFSYGAEASLKKRKRQDGSTEYTVIARHNPLTGRIEAETGDAEGGPDDALYRECISWCNPVEYEKYLQQVGPSCLQLC